MLSIKRILYILTVVLIVVLSSYSGMFRCMPYNRAESEKDKATLQINQLSKRINQFRFQFGYLPTSLSEVLNSGTPNDPWGIEIQYQIVKKNYFIRSAGPDKKFGTIDDITFSKSGIVEE